MSESKPGLLKPLGFPIHMWVISLFIYFFIVWWFLVNLWSIEFGFYLHASYVNPWRHLYSNQEIININPMPTSMASRLTRLRLTCSVLGRSPSASRISGITPTVPIYKKPPLKIVSYRMKRNAAAIVEGSRYVPAVNGSVKSPIWTLVPKMPDAWPASNNPVSSAEDVVR